MPSAARDSRAVAARQAAEAAAGFPAPYIYKIPNVRAKHAGVAINAGLVAGLPGPGHPQGSFGMESILDDIAVKLGMDPIEIRLKNDPFEIRRKRIPDRAREIRMGGEIPEARYLAGADRRPA